MFPYTQWEGQHELAGDYEIVKVNVADAMLPAPDAEMTTRLLTMQYGKDWLKPKRSDKFFLFGGNSG